MVPPSGVGLPELAELAAVSKTPASTAVTITTANRLLGNT
jgi:hypothetical protein